MDIISKALQVLPYSAHANENVEVLYNFENITNALKEKIEVKFYLSHNSWISTGDYEIGSYEINSIEKGTQSGVKRANLHLPTADDEFWLDKGDATYYIGALIANYNAIDLFSKDAYRQFITHDAIKVKNLFVPDKVPVDSNQNYIDLVGKKFSVDPSDRDHRVHPGESIDIKYQIANLGDHNAGKFKVEFYISSNPYISKDDHKIGEQHIDSVHKSSVTDIKNGTFHLPDASDEIWSHFDGAYYVGMIINGDHQVTELSHRNNQNQGQYLDSDTVEVVRTHPEEGADLVGVHLNLVDKGYEHNPLEVGDEFQVKYGVLNKGGGYAKFFGNEFFLVKKDVLHDYQQFAVGDVDKHNIYGLFDDYDSAFIQLESYGYTGKQEATLTIPEHVSAGHYALVMQTDVFNEVQETNEYNNIEYVDIYIDGPADLFNQHLEILEEVSEEDPLLLGEDFTVKYEVVNKGGEHVPFSATHFYFITPEFKEENSDVEFSDIRAIPDRDENGVYPLYGDAFTEVIALGAGESTGKQTISFEVPDDLTPGKYFLAIQSDVFKEVDESNEKNNSLWEPTQDYVEVHIGIPEVHLDLPGPSDSFDGDIVV